MLQDVMRLNEIKGQEGLKRLKELKEVNRRKGLRRQK
jgi:hypothetical protein